MKFRKKPVVIEAFKYYGDLMNKDGNYYVPEWAILAHKAGTLYYDAIDREPCELFVETLEGKMHVCVGDYVIQGVNGDLYQCKQDIFEKTYEAV